MADALIHRVQRIVRVGGHRRRRTVSFKDGTELTYRLDAGDVRAIAEVWITRAYELPFELRARNIVDFGANIGVAGVWFVKRYGGSKLVAVEPVPENAELARVNLTRTGIETEVITAAVGPNSGSGHFKLSDASTLGRLGDNGIEVRVVTPQSVIDRFPAGEGIDLVKIDVEGKEKELFAADLAWLERVACLVLELHTDRVDWQDICDVLQRRGLLTT